MKHVLLAIGPSPEMGGGQKVFLTCLLGLLKKGCSITAVVTRGPLAEQLQGCRGVSVHLIDYSSASCLWEIAKILKCSHFDIVNTYLTKCSLFFSFVNLFYGNVICCTLLNEITHEKLNRFQKYVYPLFYCLLSRICAGIIVNSNQNKKHLVQVAGINPKRINVIYSGIDIERFVDSPSSAKEDKKFTIGTVGRLSLEKGQNYLLAALGLLNNLDYRCVIVGDGPLRGELEKSVENKNLQGRVVFTGFQANVAAFMRKMDIVVVPSINETFGIVIVEAFALKKLVVATDVGGIPELVRNNVTGYIVPSKNPGALAQTITHAYNNAEECRQIALNAYDFVVKNFTSEIMVDNTLKYYERLLVR